jgi:hypothetical protein
MTLPYFRRQSVEDDEQSDCAQVSAIEGPELETAVQAGGR